VVFPAPFGPISEKISPSPTSKLTSLSAARPPNESDSASTLSSAKAALVVVVVVVFFVTLYAD
jgi:hypothetical protein